MLTVAVACCRLLGTPDEKVWPGVSTLRDWHAYPQWKPHNLARAVPELDPGGVDLLNVSVFHSQVQMGDILLESCIGIGGCLELQTFFAWSLMA